MEQIQEQVGELSKSNDQQVSPETQKAIESEKKSGNKMKKVMWILGVLCVLSLAAMISSSIFSGKRATTRPSQGEGEQTEEQEETEVTKPEEPIQESKTYINKDQRFEFTYPIELGFEQLTVFSEDPTHYRIVYKGSLQNTEINKEEDLVDGYIFRVAVHNNVTTPLLDLVKMKRDKFDLDCPDSATISEETQVTVNGEKGYKFTVDNCKQNYIVNMVGYFGNVYEIFQVYKGDVGYKLSYKNSLGEIMQTFMFIRDRAPVDPDGLQAYENTEYGFSFRHPYLNTSCCTISGPTGEYITQIASMAALDEDIKEYKGKVNGIGVYIDENERNLEFEDYVKIKKDELLQGYRIILSKNPDPIETEITLDGKKAYYLRGYSWWGDTVLIPLNTKKYILVIIKTELEEGEFDDAFDKILNTFKFIPNQ